MIIIDGYNFLRGQGDQSARKKLIDLLTRYQRSRKEKITLVFDNRVRQDSLRHLLSHKLEILFANPRLDGPDQSADNRILRLCAKMLFMQHNPSQLTVVTDDKLLGDRLRGIGMAKDSIISVQSFSGRMESQSKVRHCRIKIEEKPIPKFTADENVQLLQEFEEQLSKGGGKCQ